MSRIIFMLLLCLGFQSIFAADLPITEEPPQTTAVAQEKLVPLGLDPNTVCNALRPEGLQARTGYKGSPDSRYRCDSKKKTLNAGGGTPHEIRFYATGQADSVELLVIELAVHSKQDMQRAHRLMKEYADALTQRTLSMALPAQVADAIMGAVSGRWSIDGREFSLRRKSLPYWGHELLLFIR